MEEQAHIERARKALKSAKLLLQHDLVEDAFSRAYYGLIHLIMALLLRLGEDLPKTHSGIVAKAWSHRGRLGLTEDEVRRISRVQSLRENGDYSAISGLSREDVETLIRFVESLGERNGVKV